MASPLAAAAVLAALSLTAAASPPSIPGGSGSGSDSESSAGEAPVSSAPGTPPATTPSADTAGSAGDSIGPASSAPDGVTIEVAKTIPGVPPTTPGSAPPNASIDQLVAASQRFLGPTADMAAPFAGLVEVPPGLPTPAGSTVVDMLLSLQPDDADPEDSYYYGSVDFTSTATPADIVSFYQALLPAAGYPQSGDSTNSDEFGRRRDLEFDNPNAAYDYADISVTVTESVAAGDDGEEEGEPIHELLWYGDADPSVLEPFLGWAPHLPLPADAVPIEVLFSTSNLFGVSSTSVEVVYLLPTTDAAAIHDAFESQLPVAGYALDAEYDSDDSTTMTGPGIPQLSIYWSEGSPTGARATVRGRVVT